MSSSSETTPIPPRLPQPIFAIAFRVELETPYPLDRKYAGPSNRSGLYERYASTLSQDSLSRLRKNADMPFEFFLIAPTDSLYSPSRRLAVQYEAWASVATGIRIEKHTTIARLIGAPVNPSPRPQASRAQQLDNKLLVLHIHLSQSQGVNPRGAHSQPRQVPSSA
ncbi:hypothetical protein Pfo_013937 [Paulownia fortunei]|nr:hypothetical protein Pfo_013937 [Paulownia fortunei]